MLNKTSILVQNLKCGGCANTLTTKISTFENISEFHVDLEESKVSFNYLNDADVIQIKDKLKQLGYPPVHDDNSLASKAKSFVSCAIGKFSK